MSLTGTAYDVPVKAATQFSSLSLMTTARHLRTGICTLYTFPASRSTSTGMTPLWHSTVWCSNVWCKQQTGACSQNLLSVIIWCSNVWCKITGFTECYYLMFQCLVQNNRSYVTGLIECYYLMFQCLVQKTNRSYVTEFTECYYLIFQCLVKK